MKKIIVIICLIVTGCETYYQNPEGEGVAKIRFVNQLSYPLLIISHANNSDCSIDNGGGIMGVITPKEIADPLGLLPPHVSDYGYSLGIGGNMSYESKRVIERRVKGDTAFKFTLNRVFPVPDSKDESKYTQCRITAEFKPEQRKQYEIRYTEDTEKCYVSVLEIDSFIQNEYRPVRFNKIDETCP